MRRLTRAVAAASVLFALTGCAPSPGSASRQPTTDAGGELTVFAAASLGTAFDQLATEFEAAHPELDVRPIVYDGSSTLATQLIEGAPADVFASADEANMARIADAGLTEGAPGLFARNTLVIVVPAGNPGKIERLADFADDHVTVVLCDPEVPCGAASETLLAHADVLTAPASLEQNVTAVLTKVAAGEADAGLVYATDAASRTDVEAIVPEGAADVVNRYSIAPLADAKNPDAAGAFVAYVMSDAGQAILAELGFEEP